MTVLQSVINLLDRWEHQHDVFSDAIAVQPRENCATFLQNRYEELKEALKKARIKELEVRQKVESEIRAHHERLKKEIDDVLNEVISGG